ncbi:uncharacterized protein C1orf146 homolog isoform X1 [Motacilla alba alba]|uniref:uncharacterized protein C1orf146 homolog isoform X1 n=1 Tax=Motacilla alba alba TaxID=1094192 RepID=UPI0018D521F4|nr:uncharacterized protein C1orf146 homolog isoform X1 [Motacilla alba alba]
MCPCALSCVPYLSCLFSQTFQKSHLTAELLNHWEKNDRKLRAGADEVDNDGHYERSSAGIAFILSDTQDLLRTGEEEFSKRIQKFINIHRNSFLVLSAALHGAEEWSVMFRIQRRFLGSNLRVIPVHNPAETVKLMLTMAKVTSKPQADDTRCKIEMTKAQIIERSPVWKMLQEYQSHHN